MTCDAVTTDDVPGVSLSGGRARPGRWKFLRSPSSAARDLARRCHLRPCRLAGAVLTLDAMHAQHDTAQLILSRGAGCVMTKANMPALYKQLKKLPWTAVPPSRP